MSALPERALRTLLSWLAIVLLVFPVGGAVWLGVAHGESPCILCWAQRTSVLLIALVALFVVRYGARPRYVGLLVVLGAWGTFMGLRHWSLHISRDVGQGFAGTILGVHTYTWSWFIHWVVLLAGGAVLLFVRGPLGGSGDAEPRRAGWTGHLAMALLVFMAGANAVQAFVSTGPPPFIGQADPVRLSLDPSRWVWGMGELQGSVSWRGSWAIPEPDASSVDPDPASGPLAGLAELAVVRRERIGAPLDGRLVAFATASGGAAAAGEPTPSRGGAAAEDAQPAAGDAQSAAEGEQPEAEGERPDARGAPVLAVTEGFGVHVLDGAMSEALHRVVLDPYFAVHLTPLAGAALLGPDTLAVMSTNKSYVLLTPDPAADEALEWRHFLETDGSVRELRRSRFGTMRARQMYALSLAFDPAADELITVTVPSPEHRRLVVSRFDRSDFVLSSEFEPELAEGLELRGEERGLGEYYVTGAAVADGLLYAVSAAHSTLLVVDLERERVSAAYALPGIAEPVGLAVRDGELLVAEADGEIVVFERPARVAAAEPSAPAASAPLR